MAADKFAECQKTIASLGQQLKSLASLEDVLLDPEKQQEITTGETKNGIEPQNLHSSDLSLPKRDSEFSHPLKHRNIRKPPMTTRSNGMG